jgi:hypothetical protein
VGQSTYVDRSFSHAVISGMYTFHASASAYATYWSNSFALLSKITRRQIWQTFVQESIRMVASASHANLTLPDGLRINDITTQAFAILGEGGIIRSANGHECSECTHPYKAVADRITGDDPAAVMGIDENHAVPRLIGPDSHRAAQDAAQARQQAVAPAVQTATAMDVDYAPVKMVVLDGIVVGHQVSCLVLCV